MCLVLKDRDVNDLVASLGEAKARLLFGLFLPHLFFLEETLRGSPESSEINPD
jgi:hypothetical protein